MTDKLKTAMDNLAQSVREKSDYFALKMLFEQLSELCDASDKKIILMIDEIDSATNNQVFIDFLAQLRAQYLKRFYQAAFKSVILAGVYDVKNLKQKIRPNIEHKYNSPWNIAADFDIDMSFSKEDIAGMLWEYEQDQQTGMNIREIARMLYDYTSGYPFLVSRLCQLLDKHITRMPEYQTRNTAWTKSGLNEAVRMVLSEKNTLFESLIRNLHDYPQLNVILRALLFTGRTFSYSADESIIGIATMFGFIKNLNGNVAIANRLFETRLYNYYLAEDAMQETDIYKASLLDKNLFITDGYLNMKRILEKFVLHFHDIYGSCGEKFLEEEGRQYFLLYLRPIINGVGNYYIESRTRDLRRTDVIVDYRDEQYIIEMKIWHGDEYNTRGEKQLLNYLDDYHINKGYMLSFNFNRNKTIGVREITIGEKKIIEAVV